MRLLLDTHVLIWALIASGKLPARIAEKLIDPDNEILFSPVSIYEIEWKTALGKLPTPKRPIIDLCQAQGFLELPISADHAATAARLPPEHRDPWDRLLAAQAMVEQVPLVSCDSHIARLGVATVW